MGGMKKIIGIMLLVFGVASAVLNVGSLLSVSGSGGNNVASLPGIVFAILTITGSIILFIVSAALVVSGLILMGHRRFLGKVKDTNNKKWFNVRPSMAILLTALVFAALACKFIFRIF